MTPVLRTDSALDAFAEFVESEAARLVNLPALLLTGEPGIGKTHLLCDVATRRLQAGQPTLVLFGQHFGPGDPWPHLLQRLELDCTPDVFLGALSAAAEAADARALLLIDALNESAAPTTWQNYLAAFVAKISGFLRLGIALACRTSFVPVVIPDGMLPDKLVQVHHPGFSERTAEAVRRFFEEFKLARPDFPLVVPEFRNPLFLKLMCQALRERGEARFPRGATAVTTLFSLFLQGVERRLSAPDRCDYPDSRRLVQAAVDALAKEMLTRETEWLPFDVADDLTKAILQRAEWSRSLLCGLLTEGVLIRHRWRGDVEVTDREVVGFAYQRLGDHARAAVICSDAAGVESVQARVKAWSVDLQTLYQHSNLLEALSIHVPERFDGREVHELVDRPLAPPVRDAYLHSLIWRKPTAFREDLSVPYLNRIARTASLFHDPVLDTLLEIACVPEHPLNAEFLHRNLLRRTLPERDARWTAHLRYSHDPDTPVGRLIEWAWHEDTAPCADDAALLAGIVLAWCLTSSTRGVRDSATKALVSLLRSRPTVLGEVLTRFQSVNDPYVAERLHAVAYGCAMVNRDPAVVGQVAVSVYREVFAAGQPPVHVLLRDYARGTVERALQLEAPLPGVDPQKVRPPYRSPWPLRAPTPEAIEASKASEGDPYATIRFSVLEWDFHRYVIQPAVSRFLAPNQPAKRRAERRRREEAAATAAEAFKHSLTERQRVALREFAASDRVAVNHFINDLSEEQRARWLEAQRLRVASPDQGRPVPFDAHLASRWVFKRILDMGWTPQRFSELDRLLQQDRYHLGHGTERIGKKYEWIAFHELLARLADHCQIHERWGDGRPLGYEGPWQLGVRDIDPSLLLASMLAASQEAAARPWWAPVAVDVPEAVDKDAKEAWLQTLPDLPPLLSLIDVRDPQGRRWLVLDGNYEWAEAVPPELDPDRVDRCTVWLSLESYVVRRADVGRFVPWARDQHWFDGWTPERRRLGDVYLGEYPWHPAAADARGDWDIPDRGICSPVPLLMTTAMYAAGHGADASSDRSVRSLVPSSHLLEGMSAVWRGADFEYVDTRGIVVASDPSARRRGPSCALVDYETFATYLDRHAYALVWTVLGRKSVSGPSLTNLLGIHGRTELSGVLTLKQDAVQQESLRLKYVPPRGSR